MKFGVVTFPGSNCDYDLYAAIKDQLSEKVEFIWHKQDKIDGFDCVCLPGGFSYGDYLRTGAIARFSPVMGAVIDFANGGGLVIGICNGFQTLLESGLLPGAMLRNKKLRFICKHVHLHCETNYSPFSAIIEPGDVLKIPIAHTDGSYYADPGTIEELKRNKQIIFRYSTAAGRITEEANPNGSLENIAGLCNRTGNVFGMMPHPERAVEKLLGSADGLKILKSIVAYRSIRVSA